MTDLIDLKACMITDGNRQRLGTLLRAARRDGRVAKLILDRLEEKLELSMAAADGDIPNDLVVMNSQFRVRYRDDGQTAQLMLVYPDAANSTGECVCVFSPLGCELLGRQVGESIQFEAAGCTRQLQLTDVLF